MNRTRALLGLAGFAAGIAVVAITVHSAHADTPVAQAILGLLIVWSFVGCGLLAWARRPENRIGPIMVAVGFSWFLSSLQLANGATLYTIGLVCGLLPLGFLVHLVLAFPDGRLQSPTLALLQAPPISSTLLVLPGLFFFDPQATDCPDCPSNELLISRNDAVADGFALVTNVLGGLVALATLAILVHRWRLATAPQRRVIAPVLWAGVLAGLAAMALFASAITGGRGGLRAPCDLWRARLYSACVPDRAAQAPDDASPYHPARRRAQPGAGARPAARALARISRDPDLALGYWLPGSKTFVDIAGQPLELPVAKRDRVTPRQSSSATAAGSRCSSTTRRSSSSRSCSRPLAQPLVWRSRTNDSRPSCERSSTS